MKVLSKKRLADLLKRAAMNIYEFNTGVVRATNPHGDFRALVTMSFDDGYGDCVGIGFRNILDGKGVWHAGSFSPARARLIAYQILERCNRLEKTDPKMKCIDKEAA